MATRQPVFSVITPVFNGEGYIRRCYESLLSQTFDQWEWVVVNDGSTDGTAQIVREIPDERIRLIDYAENRGRGFARTAAIAASRGEWMVVWDADDLYFPDRLERTHDAKRMGYDFCCSYAAVVDNRMQLKGVRGFHPGAHGIPRHFVHHSLGCRMDIARRIGYDPKFRTGEDATITWVLSAMYRGLFIDEALTVYQEEREVSLTKAIDTNQAQIDQIKKIRELGMLPLGLGQYLNLLGRLLFKRTILEMMRLSPSIYRMTLKRRSYGVTLPGYTLSADRLDYLKRFAVPQAV